jgi:hypothetical protein
MEVMPDIFAVIVWLLVLASQIRWQRAAAPLAAMRLRVHFGQSALKILIAHVMPARQAAVRQQPAIVEVVTGTRPTAFHDLEQRSMSNRAEVAAHLWQRQSGQRFLGFDSVITHRLFELKVQVDGPKAE